MPAALHRGLEEVRAASLFFEFDLRSDERDLAGLAYTATCEHERISGVAWPVECKSDGQIFVIVDETASQLHALEQVFHGHEEGWNETEPPAA